MNKVALLARKKVCSQKSLILSCMLRFCGIDKCDGSAVLLEPAAGLQ